MSRSPIVLVSGPAGGGQTAWLCTRLMVSLAGGAPKRVTSANWDGSVSFDGVVLGGGADVCPYVVGEQADRGVRDCDASISDYSTSGRASKLLRHLRGVKVNDGHDHLRDEFEAQLFREALTSGVPILGICRGAQLMNLVCGGSLDRDLRDHYAPEGNPRSALPVKNVALTSGSALEFALGEVGEVAVNSLHSHAVCELGDGFRAVARDRAGVIQGIERGDDSPFCVGVQWHPEYLPQRQEQRRLFQTFIEKCQVRA